MVALVAPVDVARGAGGRRHRAHGDGGGSGGGGGESAREMAVGPCASHPAGFVDGSRYRYYLVTSLAKPEPRRALSWPR